MNQPKIHNNVHRILFLDFKLKFTEMKWSDFLYFRAYKCAKAYTAELKCNGIDKISGANVYEIHKSMISYRTDIHNSRHFLYTFFSSNWQYFITARMCRIFLFQMS